MPIGVKQQVEKGEIKRFASRGLSVRSRSSPFFLSAFTTSTSITWPKMSKPSKPAGQFGESPRLSIPSDFF